MSNIYKPNVYIQGFLLKLLSIDIITYGGIYVELGSWV